MGGWTETYRGMVHAWECDMVEHFTVAYYFDRFGDACMNLLAAMDIGPSQITSGGKALATFDCYTRYLKELRGGDIMHINSCVIEHTDKGVTLGHKLINSVTGELCSTLEQKLRFMDLTSRRGIEFPDRLRKLAESLKADWDQPLRETRQAVADDGFFASALDTVKPWEIDILGHLTVSCYVHRFSAANNQAMAAVGLTPQYAAEANVGFSTFEFQAKFVRELRSGDRVNVRSTVASIGGSSMRLVHRLYHTDSGELSAELSQFGVQLDKTLRRPSPLPDAIREKFNALRP